VGSNPLIPGGVRIAGIAVPSGSEREQRIAGTRSHPALLRLRSCHSNHWRPDTHGEKSESPGRRNEKVLPLRVAVVSGDRPDCPKARFLRRVDSRVCPRFYNYPHLEPSYFDGFQS